MINTTVPATPDTPKITNHTMVFEIIERMRANDPTVDADWAEWIAVRNAEKRAAAASPTDTPDA
jgi:hypothetical protein